MNQQLWIPYCGAAPTPAELAGRWNLDPILLAVIAASALLYYVKGSRDRRSASAFAGALALSLLLFVSPFCALTSALFSARVLHHLLLTVVLAPLIAIAFPRLKVRGSTLAWTLVQSVVFWFWHAPAAYSAALSNDALYWLMQLSITGTATAFWLKLRSASLPAAVGALLTTMVAMGLLGALITFAGHPLYPPHFLTTGAWGLEAIEDQQLAGLIMWAPGGGFYLAAALLLASRWLRREAAPAAA